MKKLIIILLLASCSAFGQDTVRLGDRIITDSVRIEVGGQGIVGSFMKNPIQHPPTVLKYDLSKHLQRTEKGTEYTSLFQLGDTVIATLTRAKHYSKREPGETIISTVVDFQFRKGLNIFMYWINGCDHWLYEDQLKKK